MNKRYVLRNSDGVRFTCVIAAGGNEDDRWKEVFALEPGCGYSAERWGDEVRIVDYFHGDVRARFAVLSVEETEDAASSTLTRLTEE